MKFTPLQILLIALSLCLTHGSTDPEDFYCCMCEGCNYRTRPNFVIDWDGTTCDKKALSMSDPDSVFKPGNAQCNAAVASYRNVCCNANYNTASYVKTGTQSTYNTQSVQSNPAGNMPQGNEPICDLCIDGCPPKKWQTITAVLYMPGNPTCRQLYQLGLSGNIPARICYPMQDYMIEPCGCAPTAPGQYTLNNPNCGGNSPSTNGAEDAFHEITGSSQVYYPLSSTRGHGRDLAEGETNVNSENKESLPMA